MAEHRRLGKAGRAGGVLDVDRLLRPQLCVDFVQLFRRHGLPAIKHLTPGDCARGGVIFQRHHPAQLGKVGCVELARRGGRQLGADLGEHGEVVGRFECATRNSATESL